MKRFPGFWFLVLVGILFLSGCQTMRQWRARGDATSAERLKQLEKQMEALTARLEEVDVELRFNVASNQVSLGKYDQAIKAFREIVSRNPDSKYAADCLYEIAKIYKYNIKDPSQAVSAYDELLRRYPKSEFVRTASYEIAEGLAELGKKSEAVEQYRKIITRFGRDPVVEKAYFDIGDIYQEDKKFVQAKEAYAKLIEIFPTGANRSAALYRLALCSMALSDTPAALRQYESVYTDFPNSDFAELAFFGRISALVSENVDTRAGAEISQYMIRYPNGRFRAEAERFLSKLDHKKTASP